jgi:SagB-type dehydrogenase family enzyme
MCQTHRVKLPKQRQDGRVSLERCIQRRRSVRIFRDQDLGTEELGQLLGAAQGVTGPDGSRAVPSAGALYPLEIHVIARSVASLVPGIYRYRVGRHELALTKLGYDTEALIAATFGQDWIASAPASICIAAISERTTVKYGDRGHRYVCLEAGHAAESLMLQAVALNLATTMVGAYSDDEVGRLLCLRPQEIPLCLIPVGRPLDHEAGVIS